MLITDWIRAAVASMTIDGREITEQHLNEVVETYSLAVYAASISNEHIRGLSPASDFKNLGRVEAVKVEVIKDGSALHGKLALYVKVSPAPELVAMVRNGQKLYFSVELTPDFKINATDTPKTYLTGIAVTDSPASLGLGMMQFSASMRQAQVISDPLEATIPLMMNQGAVGAGAALDNQWFSALQALHMSLNQQLQAMTNQFNQQLSELKQQAKETHTIIEEIGNGSQGRFKRRPATGGASYQTEHDRVSY
ncbi:MAG: GPO family capsid scaffolding protein [Thiofilum sp.]|uniref:GPO family capsid scaffolding protein n=1 Tax=Thiofilum sp. TaxID=2212733 RepID=UPI0025FF7DE7|nr:GPO family capsid scaffolding protein [Thiofilum sp.]MBK8453618.1 GPO family capsid scaffolding protein [Thiofilum sp.]